MKLITVALTAVLAVGTVYAAEPAKSGTTAEAPAKGKLLLAKKKDHSKDDAKPVKKSKK
jgi:hypothetical protein